MPTPQNPQDDPDYKDYQDYLAYLDHAGSGGAQSAPAAPAAPQHLGPVGKLKNLVMQGWGGEDPDAPKVVEPSILDALGKIAGLTRTAGVHLGSALATGGDSPFGLDDYKRVFEQGPPSTAELLDKAGMPKGASLGDAFGYAEKGQGRHLWSPEKGGPLDFNVRDLLAVPADLATFPMPETKPLEYAAQAGGKWTYKTAPIFKRADAHAQVFNKLLPSDLAIEEGMPVGTGRMIAKQAGKKLDEETGQVNSLMQQADSLGAKPNMDRAMGPAQKMIDDIRATRDPAMGYTPLDPKNPADLELLLKGVASGEPTGGLKYLEDKVGQYKALGPRDEMNIPLERPTGLVTEDGQPIMRSELQTLPAQKGPSVGDLAGFKTSVYNSTPNSAWSELLRTPQGARLLKPLAKGLKEEVVNSANEVAPELGLGDQIDALNERRGARLSTQGVMDKEALKEEYRPLFTSVDGMLAAATHSNPYLLPAKKAADFLKGNLGSTAIGKGMYIGGKWIPMDRMLLNEQQSVKPKSPWETIAEEPKK